MIIGDLFMLFAFLTLGSAVYLVLTLGLAKAVTTNEDDWIITAYCFGLILFLAVVGFLLFVRK